MPQHRSVLNGLDDLKAINYNGNVDDLLFIQLPSIAHRAETPIDPFLFQK